MPSPLHPDAQRVLALIRDSGRPPFETLDPPAAREFYAAGRHVLQPPSPEVAAVRDLSAPGPAGAVPLRLYRGAGTAPGDAALPCLLFMHGGGWVVGDLDTHDHMCRTLANEAGCAVLAVDYRLAPEHPFPAAVEDCAAALAFAAAAARDLGIDPARIAVGGDSAGGNLAAVLALMARDGGGAAALPRPCFQLLLYPSLDLSMAQESYRRTADDLPLTSVTMRWFRDHYVRRAEQRADWRASPLRATSLAGLPPAFVLTVGHDPLCDEGRDYALRLEREGVPVAALHLSDHLHGLLTMGRVIRAADPVLRSAALTLRAAFEAAAVA